MAAAHASAVILAVSATSAASSTSASPVQLSTVSAAPSADQGGASISGPDAPPTKESPAEGEASPAPLSHAANSLRANAGRSIIASNVIAGAPKRSWASRPTADGAAAARTVDTNPARAPLARAAPRTAHQTQGFCPHHIGSCVRRAAITTRAAAITLGVVVSTLGRLQALLKPFTPSDASELANPSAASELHIGATKTPRAPSSPP